MNLVPFGACIVSISYPSKFLIMFNAPSLVDVLVSSTHMSSFAGM
jgi:hypothetical protein